QKYESSLAGFERDSVAERTHTSGGGRNRVGNRSKKRLHRRHQGDERALQTHGPISESGRDRRANRKIKGREHGIEAGATACLHESESKMVGGSGGHSSGLRRRGLPA